MLRKMESMIMLPKIEGNEKQRQDLWGAGVQLGVPQVPSMPLFLPSLLTVLWVLSTVVCSFRHVPALVRVSVPTPAVPHSPAAAAAAADRVYSIPPYMF